MRASLRRDVAEPGDADIVVDDFVAAVNEVVAAAVSDQGSGHPSVDVRWRRQTHPQVELYAEIRSATGTPQSLTGDGVASRLLRQYAERLVVDERIGGSVITVRCRV